MYTHNYSAHNLQRRAPHNKLNTPTVLAGIYIHSNGRLQRIIYFTQANTCIKWVRRQKLGPYVYIQVHALDWFRDYISWCAMVTFVIQIAYKWIYCAPLYDTYCGYYRPTNQQHVQCTCRPINGMRLYIGVNMCAYEIQGTQQQWHFQMAVCF